MAVLIRLNACINYGIQLNVNITRVCMQAHACVCMFNEFKTSKFVCAHTVACNFNVHTQASEHTQYTKDACHKLTISLPYYMCGVATGTVDVL